MRSVIGGAYNGKRNFVEQWLRQIEAQQIHIFEGEIPPSDFTKDEYVVIGNFEKIVMNYPELQEDEIAEMVMTKLNQLDEQTNLICICTDIGRGIVPLKKEDRKLRDTCGRLYQQLFQKSEKVIRIWYGIPQLLKGDRW